MDIEAVRPRLLAQVMAFEAQCDGIWHAEELGQILHYRLDLPIESCLAGGATSSGPTTVAGLVCHPHPPISLLLGLRDSARSSLRNGGGPLPPEVATLLYFASLAAALTRCGTNIAEGDDAELAPGFAWAVQQPYIDLGLQSLFKAALDLLRSSGVEIAPVPNVLPAIGHATPDAATDGEPDLETTGRAGSDGGLERVPHLDGYRIISKIGEGGTGTVWRATQAGTRREVALKLLGTPAGSERARARFEREVELAARLQHPHIARVYEGGVRRGQHFCAMELIDGIHLDRYAADAKLGRREILALMRDVCLAVQHAHSKGVIHRDLKPSNVLVDQRGEPHVLDFGLARVLGDDARFTGLTETGHCAGTLGFMAPEQAVGLPDETDTRTDVYGLGATLYLLLVGVPPHDLSGPRYEVLRRIAAGEVRLPRSFRQDLGPDLEAILLRALARDPDRRYTTAGELAKDLDGFLKGEPLVARPPTRREAGLRRLRRHRLPLVVAASIGTVLLATAAWAYVRVDRARGEAMEARKKAEEHAADADRQRRLGERRLADAVVGEGDALGMRGRWIDAFDRYWEAHGIYIRLGEPDDRVELALAAAYEHARPPLMRLVGHEGPVRCVALSPDDDTAATGGEDGAVRLWDVRTGRPLRTLRGHGGAVLCLAFSPDGRRLLSGGGGGEVRVWDPVSGECLRALTGHARDVWDVAFSPDGSRAASVAGWGDACKVWDVESGSTLSATPTAGDRCVAFSPDGQSLARGLVGHVLVQDAGTGRERCRVDVWPDRPTSLCYSRDGTILAVGTSGRRVQLFDAASGKLVRDLGDCGSTVCRVAFTPDGRQVLGAGADGALVVWDSRSRRQAARTTALSPVVAAAWSATGEWVVTGGPDGTAAVWDLRPTAEATVLVGHSAGVNGAILSPDGRLAASACQDGGVRLFDVATGKLLRHWPHQNWRSTLAFSPDGRRLAAGGQFLTNPHAPADHPDNRGGRDELLYVWDVADGRELLRLDGHVGNVAGICFSPDGTKLFSICNAEAKLFNADTGELLWSIKGGSVLAGGAAFSRDGRLALAAGVHGFAAAVDVQTGQLAVVTPEDKKWGRVGANVGFLSDGTTAFAGVDGDGLAVREVAGGGTVRRMDGVHHGCVTAVAVSPDDRLGLSGGRDGAVRVWDMARGKHLRDFVGHGDLVPALAFSADGTVFISGSQDGTCRLRDLSRPAQYRSFERRVDEALRQLKTDPTDASALVTLGEWYAFRGRWAWAADLLERAGGGAASNLTLGRCRWIAGDFERSLPAFEVARDAGEAPVGYLDTCIAALRQELGRREGASAY